MNGLLLITPNYQQFAFFFAAAFAVAALLLVYKGRRERWPLLPWLIIMLWGATFGFIGAKLMLIPVGGLLEGFANHNLPATAQKTLLGGLLGGILGIELSRRWLRFKGPVADAYALVLPIATAIGRIGCLLGGCCFGTPSSLPWSVCYGPGSDALAAHIVHGLVAPGAPSSLPVHPLQLYDIVLMLGLTVLLLRARRYLKRNGSLYLLYLATYGLIRFGEEFIREGGSSVAGLKHVQWGLLLGVALALAFLIARERGRSGPVTEVLPAGNLRIASAIALVFLVIVAGYGWFTPLERSIIGLHMVPLALVAFRALAPVRQRSLVRRGAATLAAGSALLVSGDSIASKSPERFSYYSIHAAGSGGGYSEICGSWHRFDVGGIGVSRTNVRSRDTRTEYGIRGYVGSDGSGDYYYYPSQVLLYSINPYAQLDTRWVGAGLGLHAGRLPGWGTILPQGHLRLGPRRIAYLEGAFADHLLGGIPQPWVRLGIGHEFDSGTYIMAGGAYTGMFIESSIKAGKNLEFAQYCSYWPTRWSNPTYQVGLALRYRFGH